MWHVHRCCDGQLNINVACMGWVLSTSSNWVNHEIRLPVLIRLMISKGMSNNLLYYYPTCACTARGKVFSSVHLSVCLSAQNNRFWDLGIWATCEHNESIKLSKNLFHYTSNCLVRPMSVAKLCFIGHTYQPHLPCAFCSCAQSIVGKGHRGMCSKELLLCMNSNIHRNALQVRTQTIIRKRSSENYFSL